MNRAPLLLVSLAFACTPRPAGPQPVAPACPPPPPPTVGKVELPAPILTDSLVPKQTDAPVTAAEVADAKAKLITKYGEAKKADIERGVDQVAMLWRKSDGDLAAFCMEQYVSEQPARDALFTRMQDMHEQINGHFLELGRTARWNSEVDTGPMAPVEPLLSKYDPSAYIADDMFGTKVAFAILLNFPLATLAERIEHGDSYTRRQWAELRLTGKYDTRIPGGLVQASTAALAAGEEYIAGYYIWMHHVLSEDGKRLFPKGKHLITHWNLRDELKANYADADALAKQRTVLKVMERIITQTIPKAVIDNPNLDWDPFKNKVTAAEAGTIEADAPANRTKEPGEEREPDTRYEKMLASFHAERAIDPFVKIAPTYIQRAFEKAEMSEARVRGLLVDVLESPLAKDAAAMMEKKLGRKLEPFDLWYRFASSKGPEAALDPITTKKYPTSAAFEKDIPRILQGLGFTPQRAAYVASHITVDSSRGAGHAMGAERRGDKAHLRTRVEKAGMMYKGYNIAVHELGHNVEQTFSLYDIDYTLLAGVPNPAFTEALAFLFQARDLELLGRPRNGGDEEKMRALGDYWDTREIAGPALVEIDVWHWLYEHPDAKAADLREATVRIAKETWNKYYAPILGGTDTVLLGVYSHTITDPLYLFNYVLGHTIAFQVEELVAGKDKATFAKEFERVCKLGRILPDLWMKQASGKPVSAQPLLDAAKRALAK